MSQTPDLQTQLNNLAVRVSMLDGQGLIAPAVGFTTQTNARINGLKVDLTQSVLTLEGLLAKVTASVTSLWTALSTYLGFSPPGADVSQTVIPPSGS
jgi:hypothetical protein